MRIMYPTIVAGLLSRRHLGSAAVGRSIAGAAALCLGVSAAAGGEPIRVHAKPAERVIPQAAAAAAANRPASLAGQSAVSTAPAIALAGDASAIARAGYTAPPTQQPTKQPEAAAAGAPPAAAPVSLPPVSTAVALQTHLQTHGMMPAAGAAAGPGSAAQRPSPDTPPSAVRPASSEAATQAFPASAQSAVVGVSPLADNYGVGAPVIVGGAPAGPLLAPGEVLVEGDPMLLGGPAGVGTGIYPGAAPAGGTFGRHGLDRRVPAVGYDIDAIGTCSPQDCRVFYAAAEVLYWKQDDDRFTLGQGRQMSDFDYEFAGRVTVGEMLDCINGWEFVYTGPFEWDRTRLDTAGGLNSNFRFAAPFTLADVDTFFNSNVQQQVLETSLNSFELNRRWFASDLFSTLLGLRVIDYNERYQFDTIASDGVGRGLYYNDLENFLVGGQFGVTMHRPVSQRLMVGGYSKLGVFANFAKSRTILTNRNLFLIDSQVSDTDIAGLFQGGLNARYRVLPRLEVTAGYEYLFMPGIATAGEQRNFPLTENSGNEVRQGDEVFFHGANAGVEFSY